jgi:hypothetical protein
MSSVKRWLSNFAAALSLLLCLLVGGAWIISPWQAVGLSYTRWTNPSVLPFHLTTMELGSEPGRVRLEYSGQTLSDPAHNGNIVVRVRGGFHLWSNTAPVSTGSDLLGPFSFRVHGPASQSLPVGMGLYGWVVQVPFWFLVLICAILPVVWIVRRKTWLRQQRMAKGFCPTCGYDLRATPDRCPECGAIPLPPG